MQKNISALIVIFVIIYFFSDRITPFKRVLTRTNINKNTPNLSDTLLKRWYALDAIDDEIAGISLKRALKDIVKDRNGEDVIVAVLDSEIDMDHPYLKNNIWRNKKEIPNNNVDDDNNDYVDDINGWNFLGNAKGENIEDANFEYVRIYRYYKGMFKDTTSIDEGALEDFDMFKRSQKFYNKKRIRAKKQLDYSNNISLQYENAKKALSDFSVAELFDKDNLLKIDTIDNGLSKHVDFMLLMIEYGETPEHMDSGDKLYKDRYYKRSNIDFNERILLNDDPHDISDIYYGNNNLSNNLDKYSHGTKMAGVIKDNNIKIMPLCISPFGDEHDKDIALAIHYAVDNGAKVINMSFGKDYSLHVDWVLEALKYAESKNVLIVKSAGNSKRDLNKIKNFPNDNKGDHIEVSDNFLMVGASTYSIDENLYASYSNYGNIEVDIFAPGDSIYTTIPNNKYDYDRGSSLSSALTSKVAALIFSHYPNLTASQVKHIIMDSGVEYAFPVKTPTREDKDKMTPFNELSKSGKIVNAYNALIMADSISKKKKSK